MDDYLHRTLEGPLDKALEQFPALLITGPRQAGKSTLLQHKLKNHRYLTLDDPLMRDLALTDPELFLDTHEPPLIIDEIQYAPDLLSSIKKRIDADRRAKGKYVLTGSQIFPLMQGVSESLAGRIMLLQLFPLSFKEIPSFDPFDTQALLKQMLKGFYPEFQIEPALEPKFWHASYLSTYIERDIRSIRGIQDLGKLQRFIVLLAARVGSLLNLSEISKECGISQTTAKDWLDLLVSTSVVYTLEPFATNITKRIVKSPKLFFVDTGLLCYLLRISTPEALAHSPFAGNIFENMIVIEAVKQFASQGERAPLYFYRTAKGVEVDLIVDLGAEKKAFEIKFTTSPSERMTTALIEVSKGLKIKEPLLLSLQKESIPFRNGAFAKHWKEVFQSLPT